MPTLEFTDADGNGNRSVELKGASNEVKQALGRIGFVEGVSGLVPPPELLKPFLPQPGDNHSLPLQTVEHPELGFSLGGHLSYQDGPSGPQLRLEFRRSHDRLVLNLGGWSLPEEEVSPGVLTDQESSGQLEVAGVHSSKLKAAFNAGTWTLKEATPLQLPIIRPFLGNLLLVPTQERLDLTAGGALSLSQNGLSGTLEVGTKELHLTSFDSSLAELVGGSGHLGFSLVFGASTWELAAGSETLLNAVLKLNLGSEDNTLEFPCELPTNFDGGGLSLATKPPELRLSKEQRLEVGSLFSLHLVPKDVNKKIGVFDLDTREVRLHADSLEIFLRFPLVAEGQPDAQTTQFELKLQALPKDALPPNLEAEQVLLRLGSQGLSLLGKVTPKPVQLPGDSQLTPIAERNGVESRFLIVGNQLRQSSIHAAMPCPGFKERTLHAEIQLRQQEAGKVPDLVAMLELEGNASSLGSFDGGPFQLSVDAIRLRLGWNNSWSVGVLVDGSLSTTLAGAGIGGLDKAGKLQFTGLDLTRLNTADAPMAFTLKKPLELEILNGIFVATFFDLTFKCDKAARSIELSSERIQLRYQQEGEVQIGVETGKAALIIAPSGLNLKLANTLGIEARIGSTVRFMGQLSWGDTVFAAAGTIAVDGLPEITGLLKIEKGQKQSGLVVPSIALYAAADLDVTLFSGVVVKRMGLGLGVDQRLAALGPNPDAQTLLANLDRADPGRIENWEFVREGGLYVSLVATLMLGSTPGGMDVINTYLAWLVVTIDSNLDVTAGGKLWLASSLGFARDHIAQPVLAGALTIIPRRRTIQAAIRSLPQPAVEASEMLSKIFQAARVRLSFILAPDRLDFHLEELAFGGKFMGLDARFAGTYRLAIFDRTALVRSRLTVTAGIRESYSGGMGGIDISGQLSVLLEYGGMLSAKGLAAYAQIALRLALRASAWIEISFSKSWKVFGKRFSISFSKTFRTGQIGLDVGLEGMAAFDESGQVGFVGRMTIGVSICGYGLEISPSISVNPSVITSVKARMAAFESRLSQLSLPAGSSSPSDIPSQSEERWLGYYFHAGEQLRLVVFPDEASRWFIPSFELQEGEDPGRLILHNAVESLALDGHGEPINLNLVDRAGRDEFASLVLESAPEHPDQNNAPAEFSSKLLHAVLLNDPRVLSTDRSYWTEADQFELPEYAHPMNFRPLDEVEAAGLAGADFADSRRFVGLLRDSRQADRAQLGLEDARRTLHSRAVVLQELQREARSGQLRPHLPIFVVDKKHTDLTLRVRRSMESEAVNFSLQFPEEGPEANVFSKIRLLPVRQRFILHDEQTDRRRGEIQVALPLAYGPFGRNHLTSMEQPGGPGDSETAPDNSREVLEFLSRLNGFRIYRRLGSRPAALVSELSRPHLRLCRIPIDVPSSTAATVPGVLMLPYLFIDRFEVVGDEIEDGIVQAGLTEIVYELEAVPFSQMADDSTPARQVFAPVRLYLPPRQPVDLNSLSLVVPVSCLSLENPTGTPHLFVANPGNETAAYQELTGDDVLKQVEVWGEEAPMERSGFYVGGEFPPPQQTLNQEGVERSESGARTYRVGRLSPEQAMESSHGKQLLGAADQLGTLLDECREGYRYRLFVRSKSAHPGSLLKPLPTFLCRASEGPMRPDQGRSVRYLERFRISSSPAWMPLSQFGVAVGDGGNRLDLRWDNLPPGFGGVELVIQDLDDCRQDWRSLREVMDLRSFQRSQSDFRNPSLWKTTGQDQLKPAPETGRNPENSDFVDVEDELLRLYQTCFTGDPSAGPLSKNWSEVMRWMDALHEQNRSFVNSPLNRHFPAHDLALSLTQLLVTYRLLGLRLPRHESERLTIRFSGSGLEGLAAVQSRAQELIYLLESHLQSLRERLREIESSSLPAPIPDDPETAHRLVDCHFAKALSRLLQLRLEISETIYEPWQRPLEPADEAWPGQQSMQRLWEADGQEKIPTPQRHMTWLRERLVEPPFPGELSSSGMAVLTLLKETYVVMGEVLKTERDQLGRYIQRASGLNRWLNQWERDFGIRQRPVKRPGTPLRLMALGTGELVAQLTPIATFFPDSPNGSVPEVAANSNRLPVVPVFHLLERLGFAIELAVVDEMGSWMAQAKLIKSFQTLEIPNHSVLVLQPLENTEIAPEPYPFVKVAVVPHAFLGTIYDDNAANFAKWLDYRSVDVGGDELGVLKKLLAAVLFKGNQLWTSHFVTPGSSRWLTLVSRPEGIRDSWLAPDSLGHRFAVAIRLVSRYEPLLDWVRGRPQSPVQPAEDNRAEVAVRRRLGAEEIENLSRHQPVYLHQSATQVRFSYELPPEGARSLLTGLFSVRSGFRGVHLSFDYRLRQETNKPEMTEAAAAWAPAVLKSWKSGFRPTELLSRDLTQTGSGLTSTLPPQLPAETEMVRLFAFERLLCLPDLPFFYEYGLQVAPDWDASGHSVATFTGSRPRTRREPAQLKVWKPLLVPGQDVQEDGLTYAVLRIFLILTRNLDNLRDTLGSKERSHELVELPTDAPALERAPFWPDLCMGYYLYSAVAPPGPPGGAELYRALAQFALPWHPGYRADGNGPIPQARPLDRDVKIPGQPTLSLVDAGDGRYYVAEWELRSANRELFPPDKLRLQVTRGAFTSAMLNAPLENGGPF
ncbi:MAG: hypothetical protein U0931_17870 [Vulcanimicrobiota bacterium]